MISLPVEPLWDQFAKARSFLAWDVDRDLTQEWEELYQTRKEILTAPELARSQSIIEGHHYRHLQNVAFEYNAVAPNYNGSFVEIYGNRFIALEAPKPENADVFFDILKQNQTAQLVRLASTSRIGEPFYAYWKERAVPFDYFAIDHWDDTQSIEAKELITLVKTVRAAQAIHPGTVAVHCSSSIGRTGTFIAAWALMDRIDRGDVNGLSVQETVYRLCMQRPAMVCSEAQYRMLHEVVSLYLSEHSGNAP